MQAAVLDEVGESPQPLGHRAAAAEQPLQLQLALFDAARTDAYDTVDRQLASLARAAASSVKAPPRPLVEPPIRAPRKRASQRPAVARPSEILPPLKLADPRWLQAAKIAVVAIAVIGLAWIGIANVAHLIERRQPLTGPAAINALVDRIISVESNGADSKNKRSSAAGLGQFIDETWLRMIRVYRPDLAKNRNRDDMLKLRQQPAIAHEMSARFAERHVAMLRRRGLPITAGTLYLAHFAGGAGAVAVLTAPADADAALVLAKADVSGKVKREQIVKANPFLDKFTVTDLRQWADRKMAGLDLYLPAPPAVTARK
jgi:hypothetical protein